MKAISSFTRPHLAERCWCNPRECPDCGGVEHRMVDLAPDFDQEHMSVFSDQRITTGV